MDKLIEKLVGILASIGLDEAQVDAVVKALESDEEPSAPSEGDVVSTTDPLPPTNEGEDVPPANIPPADEQEGDVPSANPNGEDVPPVNDGEPVPPTSEDQTLPPVPQAPVIPPELMTKLDEQASTIAEQNKALEGLKAKVESLEEALRVAGVIEGQNPVTQVGDENPSSAPTNPTDDVFSSTLSKLNGHKVF